MKYSYIIATNHLAFALLVAVICAGLSVGLVTLVHDNAVSEKKKKKENYIDGIFLQDG